MFVYMQVVSQIKRPASYEFFVCRVTFLARMSPEIGFTHLSEGLQPFCNELTQSMQDIPAVPCDQVCL